MFSKRGSAERPKHPLTSRKHASSIYITQVASRQAVKFLTS